MNESIKKFREDSLKKFQEMPPENSEVFKYQTIFKEFQNENPPQEVSDSLGFDIAEKTESISIKSISNLDVEKLSERMQIGDKFIQMNNAFFNSGIIVEVPENTKENILRIKSSPKEDKFSKIMIIVKKNSELDVIKESISGSNKPSTISEDVLILAEPGSKVSFSEMQNYNPESTSILNKISVCGKDSQVVWNLGFFGGKMNRSRTYNLLEGEGSYAEDLQLTFGDNEQQFDAFANLVHIGKSTAAKCLAKGAFKDRSRSIFKGMIKIRETGKNASSYLACHGMLLSKNAKSNTIPGLEIETNDVKATHAASVSPIDEEKIFYLVSRGMKEDEARKMITIGYFDPLIRNIKSNEIKAKMRYILESKWEGKESYKFDEKKLKEYMTEDAIKTGDMFEGHYKYR